MYFYCPQGYAAREVQDYAHVLDHALDSLFNILSKELHEKEAKDVERKRCIELLMRELGSFEEKPVYHVDYLLEEVIIANNQKVNEARR